MDLQEWELLPDDGFLEIHDDGGKQIFSRKYGGDPRTNIFNTNYFICPSQKSPNPPHNLPIVPIQLAKTGASTEKALDHDELVIKEVITKVPIDQEEAEAPNDIVGINVKSDREPVSQVFFKKMEENEFVDMKMDSPRSSGRGVVVPQIDAAGIFQFEEEEKEIEIRRESTQSTNKTKKTNQDSDSNTPPSHQDKEGGAVNIWKWSLTGIGAICSFGVAAATVCIIIYGTHQKNKQQQNQKLRFQIYAEDKRMKEAVHQATKLNEAILISSAVRGVPLTRGAQIAFGGYYDGL
ncbi:uncharacterized protein LOC131318818 [Rhododendron vialii]|uniref:uncharacterized protein LOC131318818 n=1 Tax=Rhododendron vialii TaxID=182163 RepID=UPI00265F5523|nr:uncharacterized protein LOC131318818 [Rhododendron vialii]